MIDLTPLDVRKKRGDFRKLMRGYDPAEVDTFLELAAERLEELVKENLTLRERADRLQEQVTSLSERERAVNEALVTAQELRGEIKAQAQREADLLLKESRSEGRRLLAEVDREVEQRRSVLTELERRRFRFLAGFRQLLERELDALAVEEGRIRMDEEAVDLELRGGREHGSRSTGAGGPTAAAPDARAADARAKDSTGEEPELDAGGAEPLPAADADVHALAEAEGDPAEGGTGWADAEDQGR